MLTSPASDSSSSSYIDFTKRIETKLCFLITTVPWLQNNLRIPISCTLSFNIFISTAMDNYLQQKKCINLNLSIALKKRECLSQNLITSIAKSFLTMVTKAFLWYSGSWFSFFLSFLSSFFSLCVNYILLFLKTCKSKYDPLSDYNCYGLYDLS